MTKATKQRFTPKRFLAAFKEAMEKAKILEKAVEWQDKYDTPKMVFQSERGGWEVGEEEIEQFRTVLDFLRLAIFGVDSDGRRRDAAVQVRVVDRTREQTHLPYFRIPRLRGRDEFSVRAIYKALHLAKSNAESAAEDVRRLERHLDSVLREHWQAEDRVKRAKGCGTCEEKGYIKLDWKDWNDLEYPERNLRTGGHTLPTYCVLCEACQEVKRASDGV